MSSRFQKAIPARFITETDAVLGASVLASTRSNDSASSRANHRRGGLGREPLVPVGLAEPIEQLEPRRLVKRRTRRIR